MRSRVGLTLAMIVELMILIQPCSWGADKVVVVPLGGGRSVEPYSPLPTPSPPVNNYSVNTYDITDETTGLIWEKNESAFGMSWEAAWSYCQNQTTGGWDTWRLPSVDELSTLIYYGAYFPAINSLVFIGSSSNALWTSTTLASDPTYAWRIDFYAGAIPTAWKVFEYRVRCVRGQYVLHNKYKYHNDNILEDLSTGLIWQRRDENTSKTFADAQSYCEELSLGGYRDWRLPNIKELISIIDFRSAAPAIDWVAFPATISSYYWSSTPSAQSADSVWGSSFSTGQTTPALVDMNLYVRCVR